MYIVYDERGGGPRAGQEDAEGHLRLQRLPLPGTVCIGMRMYVYKSLFYVC